MDQDRLYVSGHSAGGHLTAMLMAALWPVFDARLPKDLWKGGLAVSGLYDLRPLLQVDFLQPDLRLDEASALQALARLPAAGHPRPGDDLRRRQRVERVPAPEPRCSASAGAPPSPATCRCRARTTSPSATASPSARSPLFQAALRLMKLDK